MVAGRPLTPFARARHPPVDTPVRLHTGVEGLVPEDPGSQQRDLFRICVGQLEWPINGPFLV